MSKLFKSKTFKVGGLVMAVAMLAVVGGYRASAQTTTTTTTTVVAPAFTYSGVMRVGMSGPGISTLQAALNSVQSSPQIVVDGKFGPATCAAVKMFQMSHSLVADCVVGPLTGAALTSATVAVITIPNNLPAGCSSTSGFSPTTGVRCDSGSSLPAGCSSTSGFSPTTGARCDSGMSGLPAGCSSSSGFSTTTGMSCSGGSGGGSLSGGETSISNVDVNDADDDTIDEGANKAPVADIEFDVDDADAQLVRADIVFQSKDNQVGAAAGEEDKPWRVFDKVYLMDGSTVLASMDASDQDNWDDANDIGSGTLNTDSQASRIRLNNINKIYKEGSNSNDLWVAVDVNSSVDGSNTDDAQWVVGIEANGLRFTDSAGLDTEIDAGTGTSGDVAEFSIQQSGAQSQVTVTQDSSSPDAGTIEVDSSTSKTQTIAAFKVKADSDGGNVRLTDFPVTLTMTDPAGGVTAYLDDVVDDVMVTIDGTTYSTDDNVSTANVLTQTFHFSDIDDDDVVINSGDDMVATVKVKFRSQSSAPVNYDNATTIVAATALTTADVEDADTGDDVSTVNGTSTAEVQQLFSEGIAVSDFSADLTTNSNTSGQRISGTYDISFKVTAFGQTFYMPKTLARSATATADGLDYTIEDGSGATTATAGASASALTSTANTVGAGFEIPEGETETFHATIVVTKGTDGVDFYRVQLNFVGYDDSSGLGSVSNLQLLPAQDYETTQVSIEA